MHALARLGVAVTVCSLSTHALAGSGPWALAQGDQTLYLGVESQRLSRLAMSSGSGSDDVLDVDQGLSTFGAKGIVSFGLLPHQELELTVPWYQVRANRTDGPLCTALGPGCFTTQGFGPFTLRTKHVLLDELFGPPVTLSVGGELRLGELTASERYRLTNIGEGTTDLGPILWLGRSSGLGSGYWSAFVEAGWRYRMPHVRLDDRNIPAPEWFGQTEALLAPSGAFPFGPMFTWLHRGGGVDFEKADPTDLDWLGGLSITKLATGANLNIRGGQRVTFSVSYLRNIWARNNPTDVTSVVAGLTVQEFLPRPEEDVD